MNDECSTAAIFPPELERQIFEISAFLRPVCIPRLMRVAWRVKEWVEPLLYRTIVIDVRPIDGLPACSRDTFRHITRTKSAAFLRNSVRNVIASDVLQPRLFKEIISAFTGLENLHIQGRGLFIPSVDVDDLQLRHFYGDIRFDMEALRNPLRDPGFANITHLELINGLNRSGIGAHMHYDVLGRLPRLTHLAFDLLLPVQACTGLLQACKLLAALIFLDPGAPRSYAALTLLAIEPRFVMIAHPKYQEDWQRGALTGVDFWARADAFIQMRRSGQVAQTTFFLEADKSLAGYV
ncbi:hypothetical protein C8R43DRAFT_998211 [Mycena crocata]|nr:hypothetical protein C8R43DRAFT_998211 [Mycena crocata]